MKKQLVGIIILVFFFFASSAIAASTKVPKTLCFTLNDSPSYYNQLTFKFMSNLPTSDGKVKMYAIYGNTFTGKSGPVHGTGYIKPNSTEFMATYNRKSSGYLHTLVSYQLFLNLATMMGTLYTRYDYLEGTSNSSAHEFTVTDCSTLSIEDNYW